MKSAENWKNEKRRLGKNCVGPRAERRLASLTFFLAVLHQNESAGHKSEFLCARSVIGAFVISFA